MSNYHINLISKVPDLDSAEVLVLHILANYADKDGLVFTGRAKLAAESRMHLRTVGDVVKALERMNLLTVVLPHSGARRTTYKLTLEPAIENGVVEKVGKTKWGRRLVESRVTSEVVTAPLPEIPATPPAPEPELVPLIVDTGAQLTTLQSELTRFQTLLAEGKRKSNFTSIRQGEEGIKNVEQAIAQLMEVGGTNGKYH